MEAANSVSWQDCDTSFSCCQTDWTTEKRGRAVLTISKTITRASHNLQQKGTFPASKLLTWIGACLLATIWNILICAVPDMDAILFQSWPEVKTFPRNYLLVSCDASCCQKRLKIQAVSRLFGLLLWNRGNLLGLPKKHTQALTWMQKCWLVPNSAVSLSRRLQKLTPKIEFLTSQVLPATAQLYCAFAQLSCFSKEQSLGVT